MPRAGLTPDAVVDAAMMLVDRAGADAVTLTAVAEHVGVRTPSLYKHVDGLADLRQRLASRAVDELATALEDAVGGRSGPEAVRALMRAYRAWTVAYPARHALVPVAAPAPGTALHAASARFVAVAVGALADLGLVGDAAIHAVRAVRSAIHGFSSIEASGGFGLPVDVEASYEVLVELTVAGVASLAASATSR